MTRRPSPRSTLAHPLRPKGNSYGIRQYQPRRLVSQRPQGRANATRIMPAASTSPDGSSGSRPGSRHPRRVRNSCRCRSSRSKPAVTNVEMNDAVQFFDDRLPRVVHVPAANHWLVMKGDRRVAGPFPAARWRNGRVRRCCLAGRARSATATLNSAISADSAPTRNSHQRPLR